MKITVDENLCIGCGTCETMCSTCFKVEDGIAKVISQSCADCNVKDAEENCPVNAIKVEE